MKQLIETWQISNRINLYLLGHVEEAHLAAQPASKGRTVGEQFAHLHQVRLMWLKVAKPELMASLGKIEKEAAHHKQVLTEHLTASGEAMEKLFEEGFSTGKIKGFKPHAQAFFGYMLAHEAHHRGQIMLALKQSGFKVDQKIQYGMWEWGVR